MPDTQLRILGFAGSLRRASFNRGLLRAAQEVVPVGVAIEIFDLSDIPLYNEDVRAVGVPEPVQAFNAALTQADGLLIATPEYNYSIPGVLKNALDWASRPPPSSPLRFKPLALLGASGSGFGTVRAQLALRQVFVSTESYVMLKPELLVSNARDKFDAEGTLTDADTREKLRAHVAALVAWVEQVRRA